MIAWTVVGILWILGAYLLHMVVEMGVVTGIVRDEHGALYSRTLRIIVLVSWPFITLLVIFTQQQEKGT